MEVEFADGDCDRLETDPTFNAGHSMGRCQVVSQENSGNSCRQGREDILRMKSRHYEKLLGDRSHQRSMRLNRKWR